MKKYILFLVFILVLVNCGSQKPKVKILSIESKGCHFCEEQQQIFEKLKEKYKTKIMIEVHLIEDPDGTSFADKYGVTRFPTNIFMDEKENVFFRADGLLKKDTIEKILQIKGI